MKKNNYSFLNEYNEFPESGYFIVENTLFEVRESMIEQSWEIDGDSWREKVKSAREEAEIPNEVEIICDSDECISVLLSLDEGTLVSPFDESFSEDEESFAEYWNDPDHSIY